jgi:hypothetical protein
MWSGRWKKLVRATAKMGIKRMFARRQRITRPPSLIEASTSWAVTSRPARNITVMRNRRAVAD